MKTPAFAPSAPARQVPSRLVTLPAAFSSAVSSPKYQTLPRASCAYQSFVRSASLPRSYRRSSTSVQRTPSMTFVRLVTVKTSRPAAPSFSPVYVKTVPGFNGNQGFVTAWTKAGCAARADAHATQTTTTLIARPDRNDLAVRCIDSDLVIPDVH